MEELSLTSIRWWSHCLPWSVSCCKKDFRKHFLASSFTSLLYTKDLHMVFCDPADMGKVRTMDTSGPDIIERNLNRFEMKCKVKGRRSWAMMHLNRSRICVYKHVRKGCLSSIKPGYGTNRNEVLHWNSNSIKSSSRYGVELAYAMLCSCFYEHNESLLAKVRGCHPSIILEYAYELDIDKLTSERLGLSFKESSNKHSEKRHSQTVLSL